MLKSIHSPLRRITISALVAISAIVGSATISRGEGEIYKTKAACDARGQAELRAGITRWYSCVPILVPSTTNGKNSRAKDSLKPQSQEPKKRTSGKTKAGKKRLSRGTKVIDRNLKKTGFTVPKGWQRNHLIPDEMVKKHPLMKEARSRNLYDLDRPSNILAMPGEAYVRKARPDLIGHQGSHLKYSAMIGNALDRIETILIRQYGSLDKVPDPVLEYAIKIIEDRARTRLLKNDPSIPTRFDRKTKTKVLSDTDLVNRELVG